MVHRLLLGCLGRIQEDDRDHFGKKRMDLSGALIGASFSQLFRNQMKNFRKTLQRQLDAGKPLDIPWAMKDSSCKFFFC